MTCAEVAARLTDYLDGALPARERIRLEAHLEACADCRAHVAQFAQTLNALAALRADDAVPDDLHALVEAFRALRRARA
jgi:anti-sigma factor RsiW